VQVRLPRTGGVRVLLPEGASPGIVAIEGGTSDHPAQMMFPDPRDHSVVVHGLSAGEWHLTKDALRQLGDLSSERLTIAPGKETVFDLRNRAIPTLPASLKTWITATITRDGKPAPGAEVAVFKLPVSKDTPEVAAMDLADAAGKFRFAAAPGAGYVIVARHREIAGGSATVQAVRENAVEVSMQPVNDLRPADGIDLANLVRSADQRWGASMWGRSRDDDD
ncbi:MAG TPA: hypothetical protein VHM90_04965, partial [Phycisphaerae bacterium]|nr:hypothetical protein [Phycisphaerae bacterium]